jgi:hypothetical protein
MLVRKKLMTLGAGVVIAATVFGASTPAFAAQVSGSRVCTGTRTPSVTANTSGGNINWSNYSAPAQSTTVQIPSGVTTKYAPYQSAYFTITATSIFSNSSTCS